MSDTPPHTPAERLALIIDLLCRVVAASLARPSMNKPGLEGPLIVLIWKRLRRLAGRIARVAAKIEAGIPPSPSRRRQLRPKQAAGPPPAPPPLRLPRDRGWLVRLIGYQAAGGGSQLRHLLAQPEMAPLLADPRMARLLRPLCHMLRVDPPEIARPRRATPESPSPVPERAETARPALPRAVTPPQRPPAPPALPRPEPTACGPPPVPA